MWNSGQDPAKMPQNTNFIKINTKTLLFRYISNKNGFFNASQALRVESKRCFYYAYTDKHHFLRHQCLE